MILRSIQLEGWRCFASETQVGPFADGLNVIHGPNGIGKSTLMMALVRGLFDSHGVGSADIKNLRPWGRSLNPKVVIEFDEADTGYRLEKQFIGSTSSRLSRKEGGRFVPLAEGREADDRAREILGGEAPGRGVSDHRHWGLAQILWAAQGQIKLDSLATGTQATIQEALGSQVAGPGAEKLEQKIADAFGQFFSPTGKLKTGAAAPAITGLQSRLDAAQIERRDLLVRLEEFDSARRKIEDLRGQTEQAKQNEADLSERLKIARTQSQAYRELLAQQKLHQQEAAAEEERYRHLKDRIDSIQATRMDTEQLSQVAKRIQEESPANARLVEQCQKEFEAAKSGLAVVRARRNGIKTIRQQAEQAGRFSQAIESAVSLKKQLVQVQATCDEHSKLLLKRDELIAPDKKTLAALKKAARSRDDARMRLDAALIKVTITPETGSQIEIVLAEEPGTHPLQPNKAFDIQGASEVAFRIPGVGSFRATGPTGSVDELWEALESSQATIQELTTGFGSSDVDQLESLFAQSQELAGQVERAELKRDTLLNGRSLEALRSELARAIAIRDEIVAVEPTWKDNPPSAEELHQQANELERSHSTDTDRAEAENELAQQSLLRVQKKQAFLENELRNAENQIAAASKRLESLVRDGLDDARRRESLGRIAMQQDVAKGKAAESEEKLKEFGDDPTKKAELLDAQLAAIRGDAVGADRKLNTERGRLEQITAEAPYTKVAAIEEEISRLQEDIARHSVQIDAVRLLFETLNHCKQSVMKSVLDPVRKRASQTLLRIAGPRFGDIHFDDSLLPKGVAPHSTEEAVNLEQLSGGEQEQLYFAVRLALADVAFAGTRQLVVLDDVFTYTDASRLARIVAILDEAADRYQIVLLTCHPERYRGLPNTKFFDLEKIVSEGV